MSLCVADGVAADKDINMHVGVCVAGNDACMASIMVTDVGDTSCSELVQLASTHCADRLDCSP